MLEMLGGRKFVFAILSMVLAFVLVLTGFVTSAEWLKFVEFLGVTYVAGNVVSKFSARLDN